MSGIVRKTAVLGCVFISMGWSVVASAGEALERAQAGFKRVPEARWSGVYIGTSIGKAHGDVDWRYFVPDESLTRSVEGPLIGGHIGIQHQWQRLVLGVEASLSSSGDGKVDDRGPDAPTFAAAWDSYARANSIVTVGPRIGVMASDRWLAYASGGYAEARIFTGYGLRTGGPLAGTHRDRHDGWFIGGGIEYALTSNWLIGIDYKHLELGNEIHPPLAGPPGFGFNRRIEADLDIVTLRLSFKFDRSGDTGETLK